jgi:hypothetical protein
MARHYLPTLADTTSRAPMDEETSKLFIKCTLIELQQQEEFTKQIAYEELGICGKIFWDRLNLYGGKVSLPTAIIAITLSKGLPGNLVMWAFTLARLYKAAEKMVTISDLAEVFPAGFPTEDGELEIWDAQKGHEWGERAIDNMLDNPDYLTDMVCTSDKKEWVKWLKT